MVRRQPRRKRTRRESSSRGSRRGASSRAAALAQEAADELGPFKPLEPTATLVDGFPVLERGQVFGFRTGLVYHPIGCEVVMHQWDTAPETVKVLAEATVGARKLCRTCARTVV